MTNVSIPVANMLKNSLTLAVSVVINISMKLCFVSVNGPREPYLLDDPHIWDIPLHCATGNLMTSTLSLNIYLAQLLKTMYIHSA
jgi:hypothetical protein